MKILFVHKNKLGDSGEAAMYYFPKALADRGYNVTMIVPAGGQSNIFGGSVSVIEIESNHNWLAAVLNVIKSEKPDVVHIFLYSGAGIVPLLARVFSSSKFVLDIRSPLLREGLARVLHQVKNLLEPIAFDAITAHGIESSWTQVGKRKDIHFLPPGVNLSLAANSIQEKNKKSDDIFRLVYIGSLDKLRKPIKMLEAVINAAKLCCIQLDIYGDGSERKDLEQYITKNSATNYIHFKGVVERELLLEKLSGYDLGLSYVPSGLYDAAPALKTLEYLACGVPVLATNTLGNRMFIQKGFNGFLADEDSFSEQLVEIINQKNLSEIRLNTSKSIEEFDWQKIVEKRLLPVYQNILDYAS